jgi:hypothetical protein
MALAKAPNALVAQLPAADSALLNRCMKKSSNTDTRAGRSVFGGVTKCRAISRCDQPGKPTSSFPFPPDRDGGRLLDVAPRPRWDRDRLIAMLPLMLLYSWPMARTLGVMPTGCG